MSWGDDILFWLEPLWLYIWDFIRYTCEGGDDCCRR